MPRKRPKIPFLKKGTRTTNFDNQKLISSYKIVLSLALNFVLFLVFGFQTMMPTLYLIYAFLLFPFLVALFLFLFKKSKPIFNAIVFAPTCLTILLMLNYFISFNPVIESYSFYLNYTKNTSSISKYSMGHNYSNKPMYSSNTSIILQDNIYDEYFGIRTFISSKNIEPGKKINYTFKTGCLGIRVMTDYSYN